MNPNRDFEDVLRRWVDAGDGRLPPRYLQLALEKVAQTRQRTARRSLLRVLVGRFRSVGLPIAVGALLILAAGAAVLVGSRWFDGDDLHSPAPSAATSPVPMPSEPAAESDITPEDLRRITYSGTEIIMGVDHIGSLEGRDALRTGLTASAASVFDPLGYVTARYDEFSGRVNHDVRNPAVIGTYALLLDSAEAAEEAYRFLVEAHESPDGWGLAQSTALRESLGDQSVVYQGPAYERGEATIFLWRVDRLVLMAIGVEGTESLQPLFVARRMDDQTR